ncbi:MAG: YicC family protein [Acidobacteria bacterium]|nr:MAG: YicC family protein [Acidobacteriota bacterium]
MSEKKPAQTKRPECLSMTGYAHARGEQNGWAVRVSVKSVNHRFLDLKLRMPEGFDLYDLRLRQIVREHIHRGHLEIHVNAEPGTAAPVQLNKELAQAYLRAAEALRQETRAAADVDVVSLLRLPGVIAGFAGALPETEEEQEKLGQALDACLRDALAKLDDMRRAEGKHLVEELRDRLARIGGQVEQVRGLATTLRPAFARRLETRLKELLGGIAIEPARLAQEAALLAERSDISEELDRLRSHLQQFAKLLDGAGELGKKLDFLLQEMHREANTMLSKTPGVESEALAMTGLALEIKADIEKLREQVQNIE